MAEQEMAEADILELCDRIRQIAYDIHLYHGNGYLEKVYENALMHRMGKAGIAAAQQVPVIVRDEDGFTIGEYFADLIVDGRLVIELKSCSSLSNEHKAQLLNYLKATQIEHGLLVNFGAYRFEIQKFIMSP